MLVVWRAMEGFLPRVKDKSIMVMSDNATTLGLTIGQQKEPETLKADSSFLSVARQARDKSPGSSLTGQSNILGWIISADQFRFFLLSGVFLQE